MALDIRITLFLIAALALMTFHREISDQRESQWYSKAKRELEGLVPINEGTNQSSNSTVQEEKVKDWNSSNFKENSNLTFLKYNYFVGEWENKGLHQVLGGTFKNEKGKIVLYLTEPEGRDIIFLSAFIYDGYYNDVLKENIQKVPISYHDINNETGKIQKTFVSIHFKEIEEFSILKNFGCNASLSIEVTSLNQDDPDQNIIMFSLKSDDCDINIEANLGVDTTNYIGKAFNYSIFVTTLAVFHLLGLVKIIKQHIESPLDSSKISLISLSFITGWDCYVCISHFLQTLTNSFFFQYFLMVSVWYFLLFLVFEARLLTILWRFRYQNNMNFDQMRRQLYFFYVKFYLFMIVFLIIAKEWIMNRTFEVLLNLYLVPQIVHTAMKGQRATLNFSFVFLVCIPRSLLVIYYRGCSINIFRLSPSSEVVWAVIFIVILQVAVIYLQGILGPRFFIPQIFLPPRYNYFLSVDDKVDVETIMTFNEDCAICMNPLNKPPGITYDNKISNLISTTPWGFFSKNKKEIMQSPCKHKFHSPCLIQWMEVKMECPTCRSELPAL